MTLTNPFSKNNLPTLVIGILLGCLLFLGYQCSQPTPERKELLRIKDSTHVIDSIRIRDRWVQKDLPKATEENVPLASTGDSMHAEGLVLRPDSGYYGYNLTVGLSDRLLRHISIWGTPVFVHVTDTIHHLKVVQRTDTLREKSVMLTRRRLIDIGAGGLYDPFTQKWEGFVSGSLDFGPLAVVAFAHYPLRASIGARVPIYIVNTDERP